MRTAVALLCAGLAAVACSPAADPPRDEPSAAPTTPASATVIEPSYGLFDPELDGAEPVETTVYDAYVSTTYEWAEYEGFTLSQQPDPERNLCAALAGRRMAGDTCTVTDGVMVTRMEEFSGVALVRDGTLLYASSLLTEGDDGLLERATEALETAPSAVLTDLGDVSEGEDVPGEVATPPMSADDLDERTALDTVRYLAGEIGPREATGPAFERASRWVGGRFELMGYTVQRQPIHVPAGNSWGVPVPSGQSVNVIAWPPGFTPEQPHLVVGAHLDTVPQSPGAEDNASGIGVMLAVARAAAVHRTRLPVVFVAFGAEEPRSATDPEQHHFGSRAYVQALSPGERDAIRGMVSLDRVGVGVSVPVGSAYDTDPVQRQLLAAGRRAGVPVTPDPDQRSSDHWSFVRAGLPGARIGSTSYTAYHSAGDVPEVVSADQLVRVGRLLLAWLA